MERKMKVNLLLFLILVVFASYPGLAVGQEISEADSVQYAQIFVKETEHNFGDIYEGEQAEHTFTFQNIGNMPLVLNNALSTCGCTIPEWPKDPIPPKEEGTIKVVFDATGKVGRQHKVITIRSNSQDGDYRLRITAMVLPGESGQK